MKGSSRSSTRRKRTAEDTLETCTTAPSVKESKKPKFNNDSKASNLKETSSAALKNASSKPRALKVPKPDPELLAPKLTKQPLPERLSTGDLVFRDYPTFTPNLTPKEVLQAGSFGGTYFRDVYSSVLGEHCKDGWKELPADWLKGLDIKSQVASQDYDLNVNTYKAKCGGSLQMWEESGWIKKQDPYGWFQWYCRFYQGRRTKDDERQVSRWSKCAGVKGRWRNNLITKIHKADTGFDDKSISPVVRQVLQHWGYRLTEANYQAGVLQVVKRLAGK